MQSIKYIYWEEDGAWLGYLQDDPDQWTQGETLDDLRRPERIQSRSTATGSSLLSPS